MNRHKHLKPLDNSSLLKILPLYALLFIMGLAAGLYVFFPRELHWQHLLSRAGQGHEARITYQLARAGWFRAKIQNLEIFQAGNRYYFPEVRVSLGLRPVFKARIFTGPEMILSLYRNGKVSLLGEISLEEVFPELAMQGIIWLDGHAYFENWNDLPEKGEIKAKGREQLRLGDTIQVDDLFFQAALLGNRLDITRLEAGAPVEFSCSGQVQLDADNPGRSLYQVQGHFTLAGERTPFEQRGRLMDLLP